MKYLRFFIFGIIILALFTWYREHARVDPILDQIRDILIDIDPRASQLKFYKDSKSYAINKKQIYLCVKDKYDNYYSTNTLVYVALHELAHCLNLVNIGHTNAFYNIFHYLLQVAEKKGYYNSKLKIPIDYCT